MPFLHFLAVSLLTLLLAGAVQAAPITFESGAVEQVLEVYGLMDPAAGNLQLVYEPATPHRDVAFIKLDGRAPGLKDVNPTMFRRLCLLVTNGSTHVTREQAAAFRSKFLYAMVIFQDSQAHGIAATANRFDITPARVTEHREYYLGLFGAPLPSASRP